MGLCSILIFDAGAPKEEGDKGFELGALEEEGWQSFQETGAEAEEVIHKVGVEFAFLAGCKSSVRLLADELESFFE